MTHNLLLQRTATPPAERERWVSQTPIAHMNAIEFVARTFSFQTGDDRFVFRPWGARGPCYLLSSRQRAARAWIQLVFYGLAIAFIALVPAASSSTGGLVIFAASFALLNYFLYWLFSIGLPKTHKPPTPTPGQRKVLLASHSRALGKPFLWVFAVVSWLFALTGAAAAIFLGKWGTGIFTALFFGACAATFTWQLRLIGSRSDA